MGVLRYIFAQKWILLLIWNLTTAILYSLFSLFHFSWLKLGLVTVLVVVALIVIKRLIYRRLGFPQWKRGLAFFSHILWILLCFFLLGVVGEFELWENSSYAWLDHALVWTYSLIGCALLILGAPYEDFAKNKKTPQS